MFGQHFYFPVLLVFMGTPVGPPLVFLGIAIPNPGMTATFQYGNLRIESPANPGISGLKNSCF